AISESSSDFSDHLLLARLYTIAGQFAGADKELRRAIELAPGVPETWLSYLEHVVAVTRQADQARAVIEAASKALPPNQSALTLARCWMIVGDARKAEALIQQARTEHPDDPATLQNLVLLYLRQGRMTEAGKTLDAFEKLANLSQDGRTWASRIRPGLLLSTGRLADQDEALRMIEENLKRSAGSVVDLRMKISTLAARPGRRRAAIKLLEDLVATADSPTVADRFYLAKLYLIENMVEKYQREMLTMVGPGKANLADTLAHYSRFLLGRNKLDEAERYINLLKKADPVGLTTLELEAQLLSIRKQRSQLLAALEERGRKVPDQIGQVGDMLARYGFAREAEQAYKAYVARDPDRHERVLALARFYATTGRTSEAMKILSQAWMSLRKEQVAQVALAVYDSPAAAALEKQQVRTWVETVVKAQPDSWLRIWLAGMRLRDGATEEAISGLREILAGNPDDVRVLNNLAWILGLLDQPLTEEALKLIDHAIEVAGSDPSLADTRAVILIRAGRYDEALQEIKAAQEMPTQLPTLHQSLATHLAWAYQGKGQIAEARQAFRQAEARGYRVEASGRLERPFMTRLRHDLGLGAEVALPPGSHAPGGDD
ncbi:MAG TPA: tetratricopeptide repeat protein, partial [Isosphaeraceae bacterium]|nr:tetratricopeptide repeat protein [Isosphaeraceae bacterium]